MYYEGPFSAGPIEPIVKVGENVLLVSNRSYDLYQVAYIEQLERSFPLIYNAGAIVAGANSVIQNTQNILDMAFGQMSQIRARVIDDIDVVIYQGQATQRMTTKNQTANINAFSALYDPYDHLSEFYIFEDQRLFLQITNPTGYNLPQSRISFYGFKYQLFGAAGIANNGHVRPLRSFASIKEATASGEKFTVVPIGGWGQ